MSPCALAHLWFVVAQTFPQTHLYNCSVWESWKERRKGGQDKDGDRKRKGIVLNTSQFSCYPIVHFSSLHCSGDRTKVLNSSSVTRLDHKSNSGLLCYLPPAGSASPAFPNFTQWNPSRANSNLHFSVKAFLWNFCDPSALGTFRVHFSGAFLTSHPPA